MTPLSDPELTPNILLPHRLAGWHRAMNTHVKPSVASQGGRSGAWGVASRDHGHEGREKGDILKIVSEARFQICMCTLTLYPGL